MWGIEREREKKHWEREKREWRREREDVCEWSSKYERLRERLYERIREREVDVCEREIIRKIERKRERE